MNKTYWCSIGLLVAGVVALLTPDLSTYDSPSGIAKDMVGVMMIGLAMSTFSLRHAIKKLEKEVRDTRCAIINHAEDIAEGEEPTQQELPLG
jgi:hypothetical protein